MEKEIADALAGLDKRIKFQELAHTEVGPGTPHGIVTMLPAIVFTLIITTAITVYIVRSYATKAV